MEVNMIVAAGKDGSIGKHGDLIWHLPDDLKRFKSITMGHPVIMGRKTWESLPKRPLPGRKNIVLTHNDEYSENGCIAVNTVEAALSACEGAVPFIIGGEQIYKLFMPYVSRIYLTEIDSECEDADAFLDLELLTKNYKVENATDLEGNNEGVRYRYLEYVRKS